VALIFIMGIGADGSIVPDVRAQDSAAKRVDGSATAGVLNDGKPAGGRALPDALKFANGLLRQRKYDLAAEEYERFLKAGASGLDANDARFGLANARLYQSRYQEALSAFEEFLKTASDDSRSLTARYRVGELLYLVGDLAGARRAMEAFTAINVSHPGLEMAWTYLGDACFGLHDLQAAQRAYERSLALYPQGRMASRAKYGLGRTLAELGDRDRALEILRELVKLGQPDWVDRSWLQIGLVQQSAGRLPEAVEAFRALEQFAPASPLRVEAQLNRALALKGLKKGAEAEALLRSLARDAAPGWAPRAALELATLQLEDNRAPEALVAIEDALTRFPKSSSVPTLNFRAAEALQKEKRWAEAQARYLKMAELDSKDPWADDAVERAARCALDGGDPGKARELAGGFAARFPGSSLEAEVRLLEARAAAALGKTKEAIAILEPMVTSATDRSAKPAAPLPAAVLPLAQYELALSYRAAGQLDQADALLGRLTNVPNAAIAGDAQFLLGQSHLDAGRFAAAIGPLEKYIAANPRGEVVDFAIAHLAMAKLGLGRTDQAGELLTDLALRFSGSKAIAPARLRLAEAELAANHAERAAIQFRLAARVDDDLAKAPRSTNGKPANLEPAEKALRVRALTGLGQAFNQIGKPAEAAEAFATALELAGGEASAAEIALAQARALEASGQSASALRAYALVGERNPKTGQAAQGALAEARLLGRAGRHAESARAFARLDGDADLRAHLKADGVSPDA
jgi:tetratricopeptide (TPR) repeat protein